MKKYLLYTLIIITLIGVFGHAFYVKAQAPTPCAPGYHKANNTCEKDYVLLAPLPCEKNTLGCDETGKFTTFDPTQKNPIGAYLNILLRIFIGLCAVLAVVMIVMGGVEYMTSELISGKEAGREKVTGAILGLLLALGAYILLFTINPDLLNTDISMEDANVRVTVDLGGESTTPFQAISSTALQNIGITCSGSGGASSLSTTAQSFIGRSTYSQSARNTINGTTANVDCSSFVSQVYVCAGLSNPGGTTAGIFGSGTPVTSISPDGTTINGVALKVGDLVGWRQGENGEKWGHVMMYIGNGQMIDAQGEGGVAVRPLSSYTGRIKYIKKF